MKGVGQIGQKKEASPVKFRNLKVRYLEFNEQPCHIQIRSIGGKIWSGSNKMKAKQTPT
jgi:hypothetical protein